MCNLYRMDKGSAEIAHLFDVVDATGGSNRGDLVYPGYPGVVVAEGQLRVMSWGFPYRLRSKRTGELLKPKPVNNARDDKLLLPRGLWKDSFENRRCLIPVTAFCEAEGEPGRMTRTWIGIPGDGLFACAGIWRDSDEWGPVFSMVMTSPCDATAEVHDRMPVILAPDHYETWLNGSIESAFRRCVPWSGDCSIDRTLEPWKASTPVPTSDQPSLL